MDKPCFLMCPPYSLSAKEANNIWMEELSPAEREIDQDLALGQFLSLYHFLAREALVYLLPCTKEAPQDLVYTANLGIVLEHIKTPTLILSNFSSEVRAPEVELARPFFQALGFKTIDCPHKFEGEAELKHIRDNIYIGGYGLRSEKKAFEWMENEFDMKIIKLQETDPYLYHLDATIFPLTSDTTLVCRAKFERQEITELEKHTEIIDIPVEEAMAGACNSVRISNTVLNASDIFQLSNKDDLYKRELAKNRLLEDICAEKGLEVSYFNLSEYLKSGALLSCMIMHLNRNAYRFRNV